MACLNHWIPRPSFQTRLYHLGGLFPTRLYHLGGSFQVPLYHLHPCRRASMQAGLRRAATGILGGLFQTCPRQAGWPGGQDGLMQSFF